MNDSLAIMVFGIVAFVLLLQFVRYLRGSAGGMWAFSRSSPTSVNRAASGRSITDDEAANAAHADQRRRALEVISKQGAGTPAMQCRACGATVDSTAELSGDGKVRCNYCNHWSSIYN